MTIFAFPGSAVLYPAASALEKSLADSDAEALLSIRGQIIVDNWDPWKVQARNLSHLAFAMGVTLWEDVWSESIRREWVSQQWEFKARVGTARALDMATAVNGFEVVDLVTPPQGFFLSPTLTKEQWDTWIRQMPQLRIFLGSPHGHASTSELIIEEGFLDDGHMVVNDGWVLRGRHAIIRHRGVDTPLKVGTLTHTVEGREVVDFERLSVPGRSTDAGFLDVDFFEDAVFDADVIEPKLYTVRLDRTYAHQLSAYQLSVITPSLTPISPRFERNSDIGDASLEVHCEGDFLDDGFIAPENAGLLLADYVYLLDPAVQKPLMQGISFLDADRLGIRPKTAEVMIDLKTRDMSPAMYLDDGMLDEQFAGVEDSSHIDRAFRAVVAAKALADRVLVTFEVVRPLQLGDTVDETTRAEDWVPNRL